MMLGGLLEVPFVADINKARFSLFKTAHNLYQNGDSNDTMATRISYWLGHKIVTVLSIPANAIGTGASAALLGVSACTLGAIKVAVFALSLGNIELQFSTGCSRFLQYTVTSSWNLLHTAGEISYEIYNAGYQTVRGVKWLARQAHIEHIVQKAFEKIVEAFNYILDKVLNGFDRAYKTDSTTPFNKTPSILQFIDNPTKEVRLDFNKGDRSFKQIILHAGLSIGNIPLNTITAISAAVMMAVTGALFVVKGLIYTVTNTEVTLPSTHVLKFYTLTDLTLKNAIADISTDVCDIFITMYKIAKVTGLYRVATTAMGVVFYIPRAIFG